MEKQTATFPVAVCVETPQSGTLRRAGPWNLLAHHRSLRPTRHHYGLGLRQKYIERILAEWIAELNARVLYGREIIGFVQHDSGVDVSLADGQSLRAQYLVGCDGGRSLVRKTAGIDFPGWDPTTSNILAEVEMTEKPPYGVHRSAAGTYAFGRSEYEIKGTDSGTALGLTDALTTWFGMPAKRQG